MKNTRAATAAASVLLTLGTLIAGAAPANATTAPGDPAVMACYDTQKSFSKPAGGQVWPTSGWLTTTSACTDINIRLNTSAEVRVCFKATNACNSTKWAETGKWTVVATKVKDNTQFYFGIWNINAVSGHAAY
ncbi:hypothetical protein [Saccharothrix xinjiangensis]|uniref:Secreted protein n=1 Tax=Saccharothrix xinjiangensis TaxID=204798 RepID=A0ABV9Y6W8_9PSEU